MPRIPVIQYRSLLKSARRLKRSRQPYILLGHRKADKTMTGTCLRVKGIPEDVQAQTWATPSARPFAPASPVLTADEVILLIKATYASCRQRVATEAGVKTSALVAEGFEAMRRLSALIRSTKGLAVATSAGVTVSAQRVGVKVVGQGYLYGGDEADEEWRKRRRLYFFTLRLDNLSDRPVQILRRTLRFWDPTGQTQGSHVQLGLGLAGVQPVIHPGHTWSYTSAAPLSTDAGLMSGALMAVDVGTGDTSGRILELRLPELPLVHSKKGKGSTRNSLRGLLEGAGELGEASNALNLALGGDYDTDCEDNRDYDGDYDSDGDSVPPSGDGDDRDSDC